MESREAEHLVQRAACRIRGYGSYLVILTLLFSQPLVRLALYAAESEMYSHILLVPFISGYLLYITRRRDSAAYRSSLAGTLILGAIGIAALVARIEWRGCLSMNDALALMTLAFVSLAASGGFLFFGAKWMAAKAFPFAFLIFMAPFPDAARNWLELALASASAEAAACFFYLSGTPLARHGQVLELPGIVLRVGQECSGIHSSLVLLIASLLAAAVILKTWLPRAAIVALVIPLAVLRNGFRILVIGLLCVHQGPHMIDSAVHRKGGPLFFSLALIPLSLFLLWLRRQERRLRPD